MYVQFQEKLINAVKKYPILYDMSHKYCKDVVKRDKVWDLVGVEFGETGTLMKKKWRGIRDYYAKHVKAVLNEDPVGKNNTKNIRWQWAKHMEYFLPYLTFTKNMDPNDLAEYYRRREDFLNDLGGVVVVVPEEKSTNQKPALDTAAPPHLNSANDMLLLDSGSVDPSLESTNQRNANNDTSEDLLLGEEDSELGSSEFLLESNDLDLDEDSGNEEIGGGNAEEIKLRMIKSEPGTCSENPQNSHKNCGKIPTNKRSYSEITSSVEAAVEDCNNKRMRRGNDSSTSATPLELIFLGYARTIQDFSPSRQAAVKLKFAKIMIEQELQHQQGQ